ncbi:protein kinase [Ammoniphilus sp. YIM 78166]|uniref:serine/threonine protein kinase n=1 Tax=Ammoniphilus sp. YIM 78166 TaxID=1644106 RepID=UPI00143150BB|nr:protein kinase [Ammoniphilus sp. YIM 78166]
MKRIWERMLDRSYPCGTIVQGYELLNVLGIGSYGITYLSQDQRDGKLCVVKQVKPSKKNTKKGMQAYSSETSLLQQLDHPSIPRFYQRFNFDGHFFFAMEYMEGKNFEELIFIEGREYSERQALFILQQLLCIFDYLYQNGISHRDLRVPNVIMDENEELKLIDFGLAKVMNDKDVKRDFQDIAHFLLFLLYSTYVPIQKKSKSWEEELRIHPITRRIIRRLFGLDTPYRDIRELSAELASALE